MIVQDISSAGTSIWLDDLSRAKLTDTDVHGLPHRIAHDGVVGVTTNPSIFNSAISKGAEYSAAIAEMNGRSVEEIVRILTTDDVRSACDLFAYTYATSAGVDGKVSIEVDPRLARNAEESTGEGKLLWAIVDRPNVMIKIPATLQGLTAITELISLGISVNATLIFSVDRYLQVFDAFMRGLENRVALGERIDEVTSVASFFVSRIDSAIDPKLQEIGSSTALNLRGKTAIANAILAYEAFEIQSKSERWRKLERLGARIQRPLWASTGVKDPAYDDTRYVVDLVAPNTVNTMPQGTLDALLDHGTFRGDTVRNSYENARAIFGEVEKLGISISDVTSNLEIDGVEKFSTSWNDLLDNVEKVLKG